jgi:hypothetical protein
VLQDPNARKEDLRLRAKGLKTLGKIFQVLLVHLFYSRVDNVVTFLLLSFISSPYRGLRSILLRVKRLK